MPPTAAPVVSDITKLIVILSGAFYTWLSPPEVGKGLHKEQRFAVIYKTQTRTLRPPTSFRANTQTFAWNPRREKSTNPYNRRNHVPNGQGPRARLSRNERERSCQTLPRGRRRLRLKRRLRRNRRAVINALNRQKATLNNARRGESTMAWVKFCDKSFTPFFYYSLDNNYPCE